MGENKYAGISDRLKALIADVMIMVIFMFIIVSVFDKMENVSDNARKIAFAFVFFLYDPLFVSLFGGTLGHYSMGVRVRKEKNEAKRINIIQALIRFSIKMFLGIFSLLTIARDKKSRSIHDLIVGSIVVFKNKD